MTSDASGEIRQLADQHAALRRVATLVARGGPPQSAFAAVSEEVGRLLGADVAMVQQFGSHGASAIVGSWSPADAAHPGVAPAGLGPLEPMHAAVEAPIVVDDRCWGRVIAGWIEEEPAYARAEALLADFSDLLATAIAGAEARTELRRIAAEQAALRRVATLVAAGAPEEEVYAAACKEVGELLGADFAAVTRYGPKSVTPLARLSAEGERMSPGIEMLLGAHNLSTVVFETHRPVRLDEYSAVASGVAAHAGCKAGARSAVAAPVVVEDEVRGSLHVVLGGGATLPPEAESSLVNFSSLLGTAIANVEAHAKVNASRARMLLAADEARRRIERDLHDGIRQRLAALEVELSAVEALVPEHLPDVRAALDQAADGLSQTLRELQEISRGLHPAILSSRGLGPALRALAQRVPIAVKTSVNVPCRLPHQVEIAAYYVVAEALANVAKHARATTASVSAAGAAEALRLEVRDDGVGGAAPGGGSGLIGLGDRVEALGGTLELDSPRGAGTSLRVTLPFTGA